MRSFAGILVGIIAGVAMMMAVAYIGGLIYPVPVDPTIQDPVRQAAEAFPGAPTGAKIFIALAWLAGGFAGGLAARAVSRRIWVGWLVAALVALIAVVNIFFLPLPAWMQIATVAMPLMGALLANHVPIGASRDGTEAPEAGETDPDPGGAAR